jgi:hypothetical protein
MAQPACTEAVPLLESLQAEHSAACFRARELAS